MTIIPQSLVSKAVFIPVGGGGSAKNDTEKCCIVEKNIVLFICIYIRAKSIFFAWFIIVCDQSGLAILIENNICNLP